MCHDDVVFVVRVSKLVMAALVLTSTQPSASSRLMIRLLSRSSSGLFAMDGTRRANNALGV